LLRKIRAGSAVENFSDLHSFYHGLQLINFIRVKVSKHAMSFGISGKENMIKYITTITCLLFALVGIFLQGCSEKKSYPPVKQSSIGPAINLYDETAVDMLLMRHFERWQGVPYRYGGMSRSGVDCSGFVYQAYVSQFNITLPRTTGNQLKSGRKVSGSELRSGDLLFFKTGWFERHIGIYMHGRQFIHVSSKRGVMQSSLDDYYWKDRFWQARRILY